MKLLPLPEFERVSPLSSTDATTHLRANKHFLTLVGGADKLFPVGGKAVTDTAAQAYALHYYVPFFDPACACAGVQAKLRVVRRVSQLAYSMFTIACVMCQQHCQARRRTSLCRCVQNGNMVGATAEMAGSGLCRHVFVGPVERAQVAEREAREAAERAEAGEEAAEEAAAAADAPGAEAQTTSPAAAARGGGTSPALRSQTGAQTAATATLALQQGGGMAMAGASTSEATHSSRASTPATSGRRKRAHPRLLALFLAVFKWQPFLSHV